MSLCLLRDGAGRAKLRLELEPTRSEGGGASPAGKAPNQPLPAGMGQELTQVWLWFVGQELAQVWSGLDFVGQEFLWDRN